MVLLLAINLGATLACAIHQGATLVRALLILFDINQCATLGVQACMFSTARDIARFSGVAHC